MKNGALEKMKKDHKLEVVKSRDGEYFYIKINGRIDWYDSRSILDPEMPNLGNYFITEAEAEAAKSQLLANIDTIDQGVHHYFYIDITGKIFWEPCNKVYASDLAMFNMGNYFLIEAAAEAARPKMADKYKTIQMDADDYFYIEVDGHVYWGPFFNNRTFDLAMIRLGNHFHSEEAAEAAKSEMLKKFESIQKRMRE